VRRWKRRFNEAKIVFHNALIALCAVMSLDIGGTSRDIEFDIGSRSYDEDWAEWKIRELKRLLRHCPFPVLPTPPVLPTSTCRKQRRMRRYTEQMKRYSVEASMYIYELVESIRNPLENTLFEIKRIAFHPVVSSHFEMETLIKFSLLVPRATKKLNECYQLMRTAMEEYELNGLTRIDNLRKLEKLQRDFNYKWIPSVDASSVVVPDDSDYSDD
jgi:hypothetical protein